jgi:hypothetical protein
MLMSMDYTLKLDCAAAPASVASSLGQLEGFVADADGDIRGPGLLILVQPAEPFDQEFTGTYFGFTPTVVLLMTADKMEDPEVWGPAIVTAALDALRHGSGDALLEFNGDTVLLRRTGGELLLNRLQDGDFWQSETLARVDLSYRMLELPFFE